MPEGLLFFPTLRERGVPFLAHERRAGLVFLSEWVGLLFQGRFHRLGPSRKNEASVHGSSEGLLCIPGFWLRIENRPSHA